MKSILKTISTILGPILVIGTVISVFIYRVLHPDFTNMRVLINIGIYYIPAIIVGMLIAVWGFNNSDG